MPIRITFRASRSYNACVVEQPDPMTVFRMVSAVQNIFSSKILKRTVHAIIRSLW